MEIIFDELKQYVVKEVQDKKIFYSKLHWDTNPSEIKYWNLDQQKKYLIVYFDRKSNPNLNSNQIVLIEYAGKFNRIYISERQSSYDLWFEGYWFTGYNYNKKSKHEHLVTNEFNCPRTRHHCQHKFYELEYNFELENLKQIYLDFKGSLKLSESELDNPDNFNNFNNLGNSNNPDNHNIFEDISFKQESGSIIIYNNKYRDKIIINNSDENYET